MDDVFRHTESGTGRPQLNVKVTGGISVNLHFIKRNFDVFRELLCIVTVSKI